MKYFSIGEAAATLHWNRTTLERRMKRMKPPIKPRQGSLDAREYFISETDMQRIRDEYEALFKRRETIAQLTNDPDTALAKIRKLQDQLAKAQAEYAAKIGGVVSGAQEGDAPTPLPRYRHQRLAESQIKRKAEQAMPEELPPGSVPVREFAERHHVSRGTLESQIDDTWPKHGYTDIEIRVKAPPNRPQRWLPPAGQDTVITLWRAAGQPFDLCTIPNCLCCGPRVTIEEAGE